MHESVGVRGNIITLHLTYFQNMSKGSKQFWGHSFLKRPTEIIMYIFERT